MINGHSDVMLGAVLGRGDAESLYRQAISTWGLASSPFDCWLTARGLATLSLRCERACLNALKIAERLSQDPRIAKVHYPGLTCSADHELARGQFHDELYGSIVTFELCGGSPSAERFIRAGRRIPFCPSLGEVSTTLSHPASTSHRGLTIIEQQRLGISAGTIRLSLGTEPWESIWKTLDSSLSCCSDG